MKKEGKLKINEVLEYIYAEYKCIISAQVVRHWTKNGIGVGSERMKLKSIKIGRILFVDKKDLEKFLTIHQKFK